MVVMLLLLLLLGVVVRVVVRVVRVTTTSTIQLWRRALRTKFSLPLLGLASKEIDVELTHSPGPGGSKVIGLPLVFIHFKRMFKDVPL